MAWTPSTSGKLEEHLNENLKGELKELENFLYQINDETMEYLQLKNMVETIRENFANGFKAKMDIGGNIFMQAKVDNTETIMVNIGKGIYLEFSLEEAIAFATMKINILNKEAEIVREESIKKRAEIKLLLLCLGEKIQLYN